MPTAPLDFTDGDTFKRFTITDTDCTPRSRVTCSVERLNVANVDDPGWTYHANVVLVDTGRFDVNVSAIGPDAFPPPNNDFPNETVTLRYSISN